jgi:glycosyltransferase involved in cell wall biosynthesis
MHAHDLWSNIIGVPAARLARTEMVVSSRRNLADWNWFTPTRKKILNRIQSQSTTVLANADAIKQVLVKNGEFPASKITVVRNAVDWQRFANVPRKREEKFPQFAADDKVVILVANMNRTIKGHHLVVEAAPEIVAKVPQVRFVFVGDGEQRIVLEAKVRDKGLEENFLFMGKRKDIPELLACADIALLASLMEGLPNVVLEYMSAGLPVVSTRAGGAGEIIEDNVSGLLVPTDDSKAIATALLRLLQDEETAKRMGVAARERVMTHFSFDRLLRELHEMYVGIPQSGADIVESRGTSSESAAARL